MRLGDYLTALLQDFTRAEMQADAFVGELARDLADASDGAGMPVSRFSFGRSTITTRVAVTDVPQRTLNGPGKEALTRAATQTARTLFDRDDPADGFDFPAQAVTVWTERYAPRLEHEFERGLHSGMPSASAEAFVGAIVVRYLLQLLVDERAGISESNRTQLLRSDRIEEVESTVRQRYQENLKEQRGDSDGGASPEAPAEHLEVLVGIDELSEIEDRLLTTIEITLEGEKVRWEPVDNESGELIQL